MGIIMKFVILALVGAVKFRPPPESAPWHKTAQSVPTFLVPEFPHDYPVPSYG